MSSKLFTYFAFAFQMSLQFKHFIVEYVNPAIANVLSIPAIGQNLYPPYYYNPFRIRTFTMFSYYKASFIRPSKKIESSAFNFMSPFLSYMNY